MFMFLALDSTLLVQPSHFSIIPDKLRLEVEVVFFKGYLVLSKDMFTEVKKRVMYKYEIIERVVAENIALFFFFLWKATIQK